MWHSARYIPTDVYKDGSTKPPNFQIDRRLSCHISEAPLPSPAWTRLHVMHPVVPSHGPRPQALPKLDWYADPLLRVGAVRGDQARRGVGSGGPGG